MKTIKADKYIMITAKKKLDKKQLPPGNKIGGNVFAYSHKAMKRGQHYPNMNWSKITPLDRELLESMAYCEAETVKMYERVGKINASLYDNRKAHYLNHLRYWNHVIEENKVDMFFRSAPPHEGYDNVIYHLCKLKNIPTFMFYYGFEPSQAYIAEDVINPLPELPEAYEKMKAEYSGNNKKINLKEVLQQRADEFWYDKEISNPAIVVPKKKKKTQQSLLKINKPILNYYNAKALKKVDYSKQYIYFPLQYQYEATTTPMAGVFTDQLLIAEILSRLGITIYVKEHPRMSKNRSMEYYTKLVNLPNIKLVPIKESSHKLSSNAFAVATATGTAGWEGILRGKPVLMFGYNFYQYYDNTFRVNSVDDAINAVKNAKNSSRREVLIFLKALEGFLFDHNRANVVEALKNKISKMNNG